MIAKIHRFHGRKSLNMVYRQGKSVSFEKLNLRYLPSNRERDYRLAVVVSRKVSKSAVVRNRIRRRIYETIRVRLDGQVVKGDIIINVHNINVAKMESKELDNILTRLLNDAGLSQTVGVPDHDIVNGQGKQG